YAGSRPRRSPTTSRATTKPFWFSWSSVLSQRERQRADQLVAWIHGDRVRARHGQRERAARRGRPRGEQRRDGGAARVTDGEIHAGDRVTGDGQGHALPRRCREGADRNLADRADRHGG